MLIGLGIFQIACPLVTESIYYKREEVVCYKELDKDGCCVKDAPSCKCVVQCGIAGTCTKIPCPSQGPSTILAKIVQHPLILLNGVVNILKNQWCFD